MTVRLRLRMTKPHQVEAEDREKQQSAWIQNEAQRWREAEDADLGGRVSGPEDWRAARDEMGQEQRVIVPSYRGE